MKYFIKASYGSAAKNKAEEKAHLLINELNGILVNSKEQLDQFVDLLGGIIDAINGDHPKCTNLHLTTFADACYIGVQGSDRSIVSFGFYEVKKETDADIKDEAIDKALQVLEGYMQEGSFFGSGCYVAIEKLKKAKGIL
jgi:hypothetical protein